MEESVKRFEGHMEFVIKRYSEENFVESTNRISSVLEAGVFNI